MDQESPQGEQTERSALAEKKIDRFYGVGALVLILGVRLYLFGNYYTINNDGVFYIEAARYFLEGEWRAGLASFYPPLFPLMIAAVYPLLGDWELAGQFWPVALGILILFPMFGLFRRIYGSRVARVAILFYGVSPYLARLSLEVRTEMPYAFFLVLALYLLRRWQDSERWLPLFLMGVSSGLAYLIRPEGVGFVAVGTLFILYRRWVEGRPGRSGLTAAILAIGFVLFAAPYVLYLRWDTGNWLISRKASFVLAMSLARYDREAEQVGVEEPNRVSIIHLIRSNPLAYGKKVFIDAFRSLGFYFEALHYSYIPFLLIGWFFMFRERFWQKGDLFLLAIVFFYLAAFALLYVTRRYGVPLAAVSLGWVGVGFLAVKDYFRAKWKRKEVLVAMLIIALFLAGTLPKTLHAIGRDKYFLREAGAYLKEKAGYPTIITTNARVAFYARGENRVHLMKNQELYSLLSLPDGAYLALDRESYGQSEDIILKHGWSLDREFSGGERESLLVFHRAAGR